MNKVVSEQTQSELNNGMKETKEQFIKRALASRDRAKMTGIYHSADEVLARLREKLELAKSIRRYHDSK